MIADVGLATRTHPGRLSHGNFCGWKYNCSFLFYDCVNFRLLLLEPLWRTINFSLKGKLLIYYSSLRHCCCVYGHIYKAPASWPLILRRSLNNILHNLHLIVDLVFSHKIFSDTKQCPNIFSNARYLIHISQANICGSLGYEGSELCRKLQISR